MGEIKLDDICEAIVDCEHKTAPLTAFGYPSVRTTNIKNGRIDWDNCNRVDEATYQAWTRRREPKPGDLILAREAPVGEVGLIPEEHKAVLGQRTVLICPDRSKVDPRYLHFLLISPDVQADMLGKATGSTVEHLNMSDIRALPLPEFPPLPEQRAIARVLGGLDDKIELNRRMNRTLEDLARGLFRSWFVDFDPVTKPSRGFAGNGHGRAPATPAGLFPKRLVDSPIGPIPEGWRVGTVGELCELTPGKSYTSAELQDSETALVTLKSFERGGGYRRDGLKGYTGAFKPQQVLQVGELIVARTDVTQNAEVIGRAAIVGPTGQYKRLVASLDVLIVRPRDARLSVPFLYFLMRETDYENHIVGHANGTTVLHLSKAGVPAYSFALPTPQVIAAFFALAQPMMDRMASNDLEAVELAAMRDALLPQLLSGEIRLREAEAAVGDSLHSAGTPRRGDGSTHPRTGKAAGTAKGRA